MRLTAQGVACCGAKGAPPSGRNVRYREDHRGTAFDGAPLGSLPVYPFSTEWWVFVGAQHATPSPQGGVDVIWRRQVRHFLPHIAPTGHGAINTPRLGDLHLPFPPPLLNHGPRALSAPSRYFLQLCCLYCCIFVSLCTETEICVQT